MTSYSPRVNAKRCPPGAGEGARLMCDRADVVPVIAVALSASWRSPAPARDYAPRPRARELLHAGSMQGKNHEGAQESPI
jgi:hypothetical protein